MIKRDIYKIKHNRKTNELRGHIKRYFPEDQSYREWEMVGKVDGDGYILICFWSKVKTYKSRGCIFTRHKGDNIFEGYYLEDHKDGKIDRTPIRLKKKQE